MYISKASACRDVYKLFIQKTLSFVFFFLVIQASVFAQLRTVKGSVKDSADAPLAGVTVSAKNSKATTSTDNNGNFSIEVNSNSKLLQFTSVGYETTEAAIRADNTLNIRLISVARQLGEVVVIGYGTSSRRDVTGSITSIKSEDFNQGIITTPEQLLQGKVAGLNVTKSGDPNQQPAVILRGPSTLRVGGAQQPFYVIDGVPGASIDLLAPADIESIDVLKDAASTAIYGSRAANGVIIVTTKKARIGQVRLVYSAYGGTESVSKKIDMLSGDELRQYLKDNGQVLTSPANDDGSNTDWQDLVQRRGYSHNHNLSYGGATANADYGVSLNYLKSEGILKNSSLQRTIVKGYLNQRFFEERLKFGISITHSNSNISDVYQSAILPGMLFYLPTVSPLNEDGTYKENFTRTGSGPLNPLSLIDNNAIKNINNVLLINGVAQVDILKGLRYTLSVSTQKDQFNSNSYLNSASGLAVNLGGVARRGSYLNKSDVIESYFNYDRDFDEHTIKLLAGYSFQQNRTNDGFGVQSQRFSNDNLTFNNLFLSNPSSTAQIAFDNNPISTLRLISYYGRIQYQYNSKYLLQASLRNDGSSAFGVNNRWGYFPAVSAGWRIIDEDFMDRVPAFSDLKLRAGYGVSGNSLGFDAFSALLVYGTPQGNNKFLYNGNITNAIGPVRSNNPDLKWESTSTINIGLDFGLLQNRLSGSVDYYIKKTSDLIYDQYPVSTTQYFLPIYTANVGRIKNSGIEFVLNAIPVRTKNFTWNSSINVAHNKNIVETLSNDKFTLPSIPTAQVGGKGQSGNFSQVVQPGEPLGTFYLWHYLGKNNDGLSTYQKADGSTTATQPLTTDARIYGNAQPSLIYGWNNSFSYKNFSLNFLARGVLGNKILNVTLAALNNPTDSKLQNIPRFTLGESFKDINGYLVSDRFLESGSYLRLDNATIGYTIKPKIKSIKNIRLYLTGSNIFVLTDYQGIDPEINIGGLTPGIDNNNYYPKTRTFIVGVNASF